MDIYRAAKRRGKYPTLATDTEVNSCFSIYSLRHRKCGVRGFIHELFVSKTRTSDERASVGF